MGDLNVLQSKVKEGIPCDHPGCLNHITHPCEGCGRVGGITVSSYPIPDLYESVKDCRKST